MAGLTETLPNWLDVSEWQGYQQGTKIDWMAVARAGYSGAAIKATQGTSHVDHDFVENWAGARLAKMNRLAYHFIDPNPFPTYGNAAGAAAEAMHFLDVVLPYLQAGDMVCLDVERGDNTSDRLGPYVWEWLQTVYGSLGFWPVTYTARNYIATLSLALVPNIRNSPLWLASWPGTAPEVVPVTPQPWQPGDMVLWQWTDEGNVPGINGNVDLDLWVGSPNVLYGKPVDVPSTTPPEPDPGPATPPVYQYVLGFADVAAKLGLSTVGEPLEDEHDTSLMGHPVRHQLTTRGQMIWWKEANYSGFYPPTTTTGSLGL